MVHLKKEQNMKLNWQATKERKESCRKLWVTSDVLFVPSNIIRRSIKCHISNFFHNLFSENRLSKQWSSIQPVVFWREQFCRILRRSQWNFFSFIDTKIVESDDAVDKSAGVVEFRIQRLFENPPFSYHASKSHLNSNATLGQMKIEAVEYQQTSPW